MRCLRGGRSNGPMPDHCGVIRERAFHVHFRTKSLVEAGLALESSAQTCYQAGRELGTALAEDAFREAGGASLVVVLEQQNLPRCRPVAAITKVHRVDARAGVAAEQGCGEPLRCQGLRRGRHRCQRRWSGPPCALPERIATDQRHLRADSCFSIALIRLSTVRYRRDRRERSFAKRTAPICD